MTGTRGGLGRIVAMAIGLLVLAALVLADAARAGTYEVAQCGWGIGAELDRSALPQSGGGGAVFDHCIDGFFPPGMRLETDQLVTPDRTVEARWTAAPGTSIVAIRGILEATLWPVFRVEVGYRDGTGFTPLLSSYGAIGPLAVGGPLPGAAAAVAIRLVCVAGADACRAHGPAWALLREVRITADDELPPSTRLSAAPAPGWHRGAATFQFAGEDIGSGVHRIEAEIGGAEVAAADQACVQTSLEGEWRAIEMRPCEPQTSADFEVDTARLPDGTDHLRGCAVDFAGNVGCSSDSTIQVDNSPPSLDFAATATGHVAATVFDPFSGPASGSLAVRRANSETWLELPTEFRDVAAGKATLAASLPELAGGAYVFRAEATDAVGNVGGAEMQVSGTSAKIRRTAAGAGQGELSAPAPPGGRSTRLRARLGGRGEGSAEGRDGATATVPFGTATRLRGALTDDHGTPLVGRALRLLTRSSTGISAAPAVRPVTTDLHGHFALRVPPGPSRKLVVSFAGDDELDPSRSRPLDLRVRAAVSLLAHPRALATGRLLHLRGRVRRGSAPLPRRGKLVTIQYLDRDSRRWRPALVVRTRPGGHFRATYRFRYISGRARIRLRATVLPQANWPYVTGSSAPVTVKVRGSRSAPAAGRD